MLGNRSSLQEPLLRSAVSSYDAEEKVPAPLAQSPQQKTIVELRLINEAIHILRKQIAKDIRSADLKKVAKKGGAHGLVILLTLCVLAGIFVTSYEFISDGHSQDSAFDRYNSTFIFGLNKTCSELLDISNKYKNYDLNGLPKNCTDLANIYLSDDSGYIVILICLFIFGGAGAIGSLIGACNYTPESSSADNTAKTSFSSAAEKQFLIQMVERYHCRELSMQQMLQKLEQEVIKLKKSSSYKSFLFFKCESAHPVFAIQDVLGIMGDYAAETSQPELEIKIGM